MATPRQEVLPKVALSTREHRARGIELLVFLLLIVPPMILRWFAGHEDASFVVLATSSILGSFALLALVCYLNWRSGESLAYLGLRYDGFVKESLIGVLLFLPFAAVAAGLSHLLQTLGLPAQEADIPPITSSLRIILAGVGLATVAVVEETVFRGYLLTRIVEWRRGGTAFAIFASSLVFALGHEYQGTAGMITVAGMGVMFATVYVWRGSLIAPIVIHYLQDTFAVAAIATT